MGLAQFSVPWRSNLPPRARRSPPACLLLGPRFTHDSNICRNNVTEGVGRLRYTCADKRVAWCLDEVGHKCSTGETIAGRSVDPGWAHSLRVPKSKREGRMNIFVINGGAGDGGGALFRASDRFSDGQILGAREILSGILLPQLRLLAALSPLRPPWNTGRTVT